MNKLLAVSLLVIPALASAQPVWRVNIQSDAGEPIGQRLTSSVREAIEQNPRYSLGKSAADSSFTIYLSTIAPTKGDEGVVSAYSAVIARNKQISGRTSVFFLTHSVGTCGASVIPSCAEGIFGLLDNTVFPNDKASLKSGRASQPRLSKPKP